MENIRTQQRRAVRMNYAQVGEINGMVPPQAVELEKSVLGALMLDNKALFAVIDKLHEGLFYKSEHQAIFNAIRHLVAGNHEVDMLTVVQQLTKEGKLEEAGGAFNISTITNNMVSAAHLEYHIHLLAEKYLKRELIRTSTENIRDAYDETTDAIELVDKAEKNLMEISELSFHSQSQSLDAIIAEAEKQLLDEEHEDDYVVPSGFVELDRITSGFHPGSLIILAARPGMGKTACALSMARNVAVDFKKPVAFFSLEMTAIELLMRIVSAESGIPAHKLKKISSMSKREKEIFLEKMYALREAPIHIDDTPGIDIFELRAKCRRLQQRHGIKMVFIDYLQLMKCSGDVARNQSRAYEVGNISRQLKEMAKELKIPVVAMAQLNRNADDRPMQIPMLSDLKDSGSIEQDADMVIAIHRPWKCGLTEDEHGNSTENLANLHILKHRSGDIGVVPLCFEGKYVRFSNFPVAGNDVIKDSMMNYDIQPNDSFDNGSPYSNPPRSSSQEYNPFPPEDDLDFQ